MRSFGMAGMFMLGLLMTAQSGFADQREKSGTAVQKSSLRMSTAAYSNSISPQTPARPMTLSSRGGSDDLKVSGQAEMRVNEQETVTAAPRVRSEKGQTQRPHPKVESQERGRGAKRTGDPGLVF